MALNMFAAFFANGIARPARHFLIVLIIALSLGACKNIAELSEIQKTADFILFGNPDIPVTRAAIEQQPYAAIRARMGRSGQVIMILGRIDGPDLHWISADHVAIATRRGRVVETAGLPENLVHTMFSGADPITAVAHRWDTPVKLRRMIDIEPGTHYGVTVISTIERIAVEHIEILDFSYETNVLRESAYAAELDWSYDNYYWVDAKTGFVWKSIQHIAPSLVPFQFEILKPAG